MTPPFLFLRGALNFPALPAHSVDAAIRSNPSIGIFLGIHMALWAPVLYCLVLPHASTPPSFGDHIGAVLGVGPKPEMGRINAELIIATGAIMKNAEPLRDVTKENSPRGAMGAPGWISKLAVSILANGPGPYPTPTSIVEVLKESLFVHGYDYTKSSGVPQ